MHVVFELVDLLADPEPQARVGAVKALASISSDISEPLLRLKVKQGNEEQQVLAECLFVLMKTNPEKRGFSRECTQATGSINTLVLYKFAVNRLTFEIDFTFKIAFLSLMI